LLPNGWHITPAGRQIETTDLLVNIQPLKDSKRAIIATSGFNEHNVALVNLETGSFIAKESAYQSWFGLALSVNSFTNVADMTPYTMEKAQINLNAKNNALAYGADRSMPMDFTEYDRIDDFELNEILWHSIMGVDAPLPPAVRRALAFRTSSRVEKQNLLTP